MNILINYNLESCTASISADSTLTEVAFAVEACCNHFLGRGVNRFECTRSRQPNGTCVLSFKALKKSGPMVLSSVGALGYAVREGIIPATIAPGDKFQIEESGFERIVSEGQHRHGRMSSVVGRKIEGNNSTSIVESYDFKPEIPVTVLTYGLGDMFTGLFAQGVNYVKWQVSLKLVQLYIRHNLSDEKLHKFLLTNADYDIRRKVSTLS
jgi:hypothetical protein